jgi:hypothetical protein
VGPEQCHRHFWHLRTPDGGEADIYADVTPGNFKSLVISYFSAGSPLDLLAEFTIRASAVILAPDSPAMLTANTQRKQLPGNLQPGAIVAGDDIRQALATFRPSPTSTALPRSA